MARSGSLVHIELGQMGCTHELKIKSNELEDTLWQNRIKSSRSWGIFLYLWLVSIGITVLGSARQRYMSLGGQGCYLFHSYLVSYLKCGVSHLEDREG